MPIGHTQLDDNLLFIQDNSDDHKESPTATAAKSTTAALATTATPADAESLISRLSSEKADLVTKLEAVEQENKRLRYSVSTNFRLKLIEPSARQVSIRLGASRECPFKIIEGHKNVSRCWINNKTKCHIAAQVLRIDE